MKITQTDIGPVVMIDSRLTRIESPDEASAGSTALALLLDSQHRPQCFVLVWEWGGDWTGFGDDERHDVDALADWMPGAVRDAVSAAISICPECEKDMEWFSEWADDAESALAE